MKYLVTEETNLCRVFQMPDAFPMGFISQPMPYLFMLLDWFNPVPDAALSPDWRLPTSNDGVGRILEGDRVDDLIDPLTRFLAEKHYCSKGGQFLVATDFGLSFTFKVQRYSEEISNGR